MIHWLHRLPNHHTELFVIPKYTLLETEQEGMFWTVLVSNLPRWTKALENFKCSSEGVRLESSVSCTHFWGHASILYMLPPQKKMNSQKKAWVVFIVFRVWVQSSTWKLMFTWHLNILHISADEEPVKHSLTKISSSLTSGSAQNPWKTSFSCDISAFMVLVPGGNGKCKKHLKTYS